MSDQLQAALKEHFGFDDFRPGQREVIERLMEGKSAAAVFPTGGGKSICFQLPALLLDGLTLVVSPLIALMKDQLDALLQRGIAARRLDSSLTANEYRDVMCMLHDGELRILYVAPERFNNERFRQTILKSDIALFAIDEAHCISEWGHNFRPDYLKLVDFAQRCEAQRVLALTATATPQVQVDISEAFQIEPDCMVSTGVYRENLSLLTTPVAALDRTATLTDRLQNREPGPAIVYVTLQRTAEQVARELSDAGLPAKAYHAGLKDETRTEVQDWFLQSDRGIVVATIAFGMGIDKRDIRYVYHYNMPKSIENYSQEIGRAGRDQEPAVCEWLVCLDDQNTIENFVYGDTPSSDSIRGLINDLLSHGDSFHVSHYELSQKHDIRILVVRTLITYLEIEGLLEGGTPFYSSYQFHPLRSSQEILSRFQGERREFLAAIFRQAVPRKKWFDLDLAKVEQATKATRARIVTALDYLAESNLIELKVQGMRFPLRRVAECADIESLAAEMIERVERREQQELQRIERVIALASHDGCQMNALCAYFGEDRGEPCGNCSWCTNGNAAVTVPPRSTEGLTDPQREIAESLLREYPDLFGEPRRLTRMLVGVTSPALTRKRLSSDSRFGSAADVSFLQVLEDARKIVEQAGEETEVSVE